MTTGQRLERDLPQILGELATRPYPDYIDDVLATTARARQRPASTFPERWLPMNDDDVTCGADAVDAVAIAAPALMLVASSPSRGAHRRRAPPGRRSAAGTRKSRAIPKDRPAPMFWVQAATATSLPMTTGCVSTGRPSRPRVAARTIAPRTAKPA